MTSDNEETLLMEKRRKQYFWGGAIMLVLGFAACVLNCLLSVPEYQKISSFNALFFVVGGALGLAGGSPGTEKEKGGKGFLILRKAAPVVVLISFTTSMKEILTSDFIDPTNLLLAVALLAGYFIFHYLIRVKAGGPSEKTLETAEVLVVAIAMAVLIKGVGVQAFKIPSGSMLNTLKIGDHLLITKFLYGVPLPYTDARLPAIKDPQRGDIVVFSYPGMDNPDRPPFQDVGFPDELKGQDFIKRIVGLPGETIQLKGNVLYIDGKAVDDAWGQFLDAGGKPLPLVYKGRGQLADYGPAVIPPDMYFVMGDNRFHSNDSRVWGFVKKGRIKGKALIIYWSMAELGRIGTIIK